MWQPKAVDVQMFFSNCFSFPFGSGAEEWTQRFLYARQALRHCYVTRQGALNNALYRESFGSSTYFYFKASFQLASYWL